jgi:hypothetical protein
MNEKPAPAPFAQLDPLRRYVPLAAWTIVLLTLLLIPLKVIEYGYLPQDDALRHAAKAVSGKPWTDLLVLNSDYQIQQEFGWAALLEKIHGWTHAGAESLVIFSVISLFLAGNLAAVPWLRFPETWLAALTLSMITVALPERFLIGRPFVVTSAALMVLLLLWRRFGDQPPKWWMAALMTAWFTAAIYFHGTWYLWVVPLAAFFLAGQFRWGITASVCWLAGVVIGSALTGHPIGYTVGAVKMALGAVGLHLTQRTMAAELQPDSGDVFALIILGGLLILRNLAKLNAPSPLRDPVFWLVGLTWTLEFKVGRFWVDWGWPALVVLMACDLELFLTPRIALDSFKRLGLAAGLAVVAFLAITNDAGSRWTANLTQQFLTTNNPDLKGWMPGKGGILYSSDMTIFYQTFYKNPLGDWRYMTGFEPALMPHDDFEVYQKILWNGGDAKTYSPWVEKMKPADRLVIRGGRGSPPNIPQLDWNYGVSGIWIGRLPRPDTNGAPVTIKATEPMSSLTNAPDNKAASK